MASLYSSSPPGARKHSNFMTIDEFVSRIRLVRRESKRRRAQKDLVKVPRPKLRPLVEEEEFDPTISKGRISKRLGEMQLKLHELEANPNSDSDDENDGKLTPRARYSQKNAAKLKTMVSLLMQLSNSAMSNIRQEFENRDWELSIYEFVMIVQSNMAENRRNAMQIDALCEMFREIDVNGDEGMSYDEFTSYLVELASSYYDDFYEDHIPHYNYSLIEDTTPHDYHCDYMTYIEEIDKIILFERKSRRFKLYNSEVKCTRVVRGHRAPLLAVTYMADHQMLATSSVDKTICFWDARPGQHFHMSMRWTCEKSQISLRYMDRSLFSSDTTGCIIAWNIERAEPKQKLFGHSDIVMTMTPLNNLGLLASGSLDLSVRLWDVAKNEVRLVLRGHEKGITCLTYSEKYNVLVSGGLDSYALVWNPRVKTSIYTLNLASSLSHITGLEASKSTPELVIGDNSGVFYVYDVRTYACVQKFSIPKLKNPDITGIALIPKDGVLITCGKKLHRFQRTTGVLADRADDQPIIFAKFNPVSLTILTAAGTGIKVWDALTGRLTFADRNLTETTITSVCLDDRNRRFIVGQHSGKIQAFNYNNGAIMKDFSSHDSEVTALLYCGYHSDTKQIMSASWDGTVVSHIDEMDFRNTVMRRANDHSKDVIKLADSEAMRLIASAARDYTICLYEAGLGPLLFRFELDITPASVMMFLGDYPLLLAADRSGGLYVFAVVGPYYRSLHIPCLNKHKGKPSSILGMTFDAERHNLYTCDDRGAIRCWPLDIQCLDYFMQAYHRKHAERRSRLALQKEQASPGPSSSSTISLSSPTQAAGPSSSSSVSSSSVQMKKRNSVTVSFSTEKDKEKTEFLQKNKNNQKEGDHDGGGGGGAAAAAAADDDDDDADDEKYDEQDEKKSSIRKGPPPTFKRIKSNRPNRKLRRNIAYEQMTEAEKEDYDNRQAEEKIRLEQRERSFVGVEKREQTIHPLHIESGLEHFIGNPVLDWKAHNDHCMGIDFVHNEGSHPTIISWSYDGFVYLWDALTGQKQGALLQGNTKRARSQNDGGRHKFFEGKCTYCSTPKSEKSEREVCTVHRFFSGECQFCGAIQTPEHEAGQPLAFEDCPATLAPELKSWLVSKRFERLFDNFFKRGVMTLKDLAHIDPEVIRDIAEETEMMVHAHEKLLSDIKSIEPWDFYYNTDPHKRAEIQFLADSLEPDDESSDGEKDGEEDDEDGDTIAEAEQKRKKLGWSKNPSHNLRDGYVMHKRTDGTDNAQDSGGVRHRVSKQQHHHHHHHHRRTKSKGRSHSSSSPSSGGQLQLLGGILSDGDKQGHHRQDSQPMQNRNMLKEERQSMQGDQQNQNNHHDNDPKRRQVAELEMSINKVSTPFAESGASTPVHVGNIVVSGGERSDSGRGRGRVRQRPMISRTPHGKGKRYNNNTNPYQNTQSHGLLPRIKGAQGADDDESESGYNNNINNNEYVDGDHNDDDEAEYDRFQANYRGTPHAVVTEGRSRRTIGGVDDDDYDGKAGKYQQEEGEGVGVGVEERERRCKMARDSTANGDNDVLGDHDDEKMMMSKQRMNKRKKKRGGRSMLRSASEPIFTKSGKIVRPKVSRHVVNRRLVPRHLFFTPPQSLPYTSGEEPTSSLMYQEQQLLQASGMLQAHSPSSSASLASPSPTGGRRTRRRTRRRKRVNKTDEEVYGYSIRSPGASGAHRRRRNGQWVTDSPVVMEGTMHVGKHKLKLNKEQSLAALRLDAIMEKIALREGKRLA